MLFNTISTALLSVGPSDFEILEDVFPSPLLEGRPVKAPMGLQAEDRLSRPIELPERVFETLKDGGFLVSKDLDERDYIKTRYTVSRMRAPARFVIAPTLDCNLDCFYCFEAKSKERMSPEIQDSVASFVGSRLRGPGAADLTVEWYGGEPLLAVDVVRNLSARLQSLSADAGSAYTAALVTNGTMLTPATLEALGGSGIHSYHVTLDGPAEVHDARRAPAAEAPPHDDGHKGTHPCGSGEASGGGAGEARGRSPSGEPVSSFEEIVNNIEAAAERGQVNVRLNVGRSNRDAVGAFLQFARDRKWRDRGIEIYPAPIFGTASPCMGYPDESLPEEEFDPVLDEFCSAGFEGGGSNLAEVVGFPPGRHYSCEALAYNSFAVSPGGGLFKCPLEIDDESKAVGTVSSSLDLRNPNLLRWLSFDPFSIPGCGECLFLPLCFGGCPKKLFEEGEPGRRSACRFWSKRFSNLLSLAARRDSQGISVA